MARGVQLSVLLDQLQAEVGLSLMPANNVSTIDHRTQLLNRWQDRLYRSYDWDFALIRRDVNVVKNDRLLAYPVDIELERIGTVTIAPATSGLQDGWYELGYGVGDAQYRMTPMGTVGRPERWVPYEGEKVELWPAADGPYTLRFRGVKALTPMVASSDRAVLDDTLIVLHAASEMLKRLKAGDWEDKLREAQMHLNRLRGQLGANKRAPFIMGGGVTGLIGDAQPPPVPGLDYVA